MTRTERHKEQRKQIAKENMIHHLKEAFKNYKEAYEREDLRVYYETKSMFLFNTGNLSWTVETEEI